MKIIKILFLGIVLVLFNIAYLAAQASPDTIFVKTTPVSPGGVLTITYEAHINSEAVGGVVVIMQGIPAEVTPVGAEWYTWGEGYGEVLQDEAGLKPNIVKLDASGLQLSLLSFNLDDLVDDGDIPSKSGVLLTYSLQVPEDMEFGSHPLTRATQPQEGVLLLAYPFTGAALGTLPAVVADPIVIADIPAYDALELPEITEIPSTGGKLSLPINVLNKDEIASGSFKVSYPAGLSLASVKAGSRAGGMAFTIGDTETADGMTTATVTFSGGKVAMGPLGTLCTLEYAASGLTAGDPISIALADVVLSDAAGAPLTALQQPAIGTLAPDVFFGDSLIVGVKAGAHQPGEADEASGIAMIVDGQLHLPVMMTNSLPVSVMELQICKLSADEAIELSLDADGVMQSDRMANWQVNVADSTEYIKIVAFASSIDKVIEVGSGEIMSLVFDIEGWEGVITEDNSVDVSLLIKQANVLDSDGSYMSMQLIDGVATIDNRVPLSGEGLGPGASLPKAFALAQNHPNPFNPSTTINYQVPEDAGFVSFSLNVYDIRGKLVRTLDKDVKGPGFYTANWDGTDNHGRQVSSGVYFYRFSSDKYTSTRKMVLLK
ncbi:MAG: T9SS type A sorting domain-containing protein [Candidatus Glassbacteria bacterium]|nr:T9SS type A sorting domain-containing protein [Candidatus Glassbacteria bacterium]